MKRPILAVSILLLASALFGAEVRTSFDEAPDSSWKKSLGDTELELFFVADMHKLLSEWDDPERTEPCEVPVITRLKRGRKFAPMIAFSNCPVDEEGECRMTVRTTFHDPTGEDPLELRVLSLWTGEAPPKDQVELALCSQEIITEESDPLGEYIVRSEITDEISGRSVVLERTLQLYE